ncbi:MAG: helix-turn-helix domain-containing protein [Acidobacteria bacterium]|nr:helix-turn-helix domain-containing protein [Acidobacteriota bacterium]
MRKTGYKIFDRYQECGVHGLTDGTRRPYHYANQLPFQVENYILNVKREHTSWGARKIRERLTRRFSGISYSRQKHHPCGARSLRTGGAARSRASACARHALISGTASNELWCTDYKGEFLLGNGEYWDTADAIGQPSSQSSLMTVWTGGVTHVSGPLCNLCLRAGPCRDGWPSRIRTWDQRITRAQNIVALQ